MWTTAGTLTYVGQNLPDEGSRAGAIFTDRFDPTIRWYLPQYALPADDPSFEFAAAQRKPDSDTGLPFDVATLSFTIGRGEPKDVVAARAADSTLSFRPIELDPPQVTLTFPSQDASGADHPVVVALSVTAQSDGSLLATATLVGPTVVVAYVALAHGTDAAVQISGSYSVWRNWRPLLHLPIILHGPILAQAASELATFAPAELQHPLAQLAASPVDGGPILHLPVGEPPHRWPPVQLPPSDPPPADNWVTAVDQELQSLPATGFGVDAYRERFTIASAAGVRPIIDANDLISYGHQGSDFRELDAPRRHQHALPDVASRLLRRGQRGRRRCPAVVRHPAGQLRAGRVAGGRRRRLGDGAERLPLRVLVHPCPAGRPGRPGAARPRRAGHAGGQRADRAGQLAGQSRLPVPSAFNGFPASTSTVADGPRSGTVTVHVQIADSGTTPAICNANLFLNQFTSSVTPMGGTIALRLDDLYPTPVTTSCQISLDATVGSDEVSLSIGDDPTAVIARNVGPFDLTLRHVAGVTADGPRATALQTTLSPNQTTSLGPIDAAPVTIVDAALALPDPIPPGQAFHYLIVHTETVTSVQHSLLYSASFDFAAAAISQLTISATLPDRPSVHISPVTLI